MIRNPKNLPIRIISSLEFRLRSISIFPLYLLVRVFPNFLTWLKRDFGDIPPSLTEMVASINDDGVCVGILLYLLLVCILFGIVFLFTL